MRVGAHPPLTKSVVSGSCALAAGSRAVLAAALLSVPWFAFVVPAQAQTAGAAQPPAKAAPASKPVSKPASTQAPHQTSTSRPAHGQAHHAGQAHGQPRRGQVPPPTTPAQRAALPAADDTQKDAAGLVYYGKYICDQKWEIHVERNAESPGYVDVRYQKDIWVMKPVASATGAVRLEDMKHQTLLVQIPSKSMLLNTRTGQRLVDSCIGEGHLNAMKAAELAAAEAATQATPATAPASAPSAQAIPTTAPVTVPAVERKPD